MTPAPEQYRIFSLNTLYLATVPPHAVIGWPRLLLKWGLQNEASLGWGQHPQLWSSSWTWVTCCSSNIFDISLSLMSQSLGTLNLMQPPALLALPLVPVRWLPASGIVGTSVGKSISHSSCLVKGHRLLSQSFSHSESNLLSGNFLPQQFTQLPYPSTCQLF